jgi:Tfp pilus assembly protein PilF
LAISITYVQTVGFGYTDLDDIRLTKNSQNQLKQGVSISRIFSQDVFGDRDGVVFYRPLLTVSLLMDTFLGGGASWFYHSSNLAWHITACCLFLWLLTIMGLKGFPALAAALLVGVHPVLAQAVAWIPGPNDVMMAVFLILSLAGAARFLRGGRCGWLALSVTAYLLALLTKETAVVFPLAGWAAFGSKIGFRNRRAKQVAARFFGATALWLTGRMVMTRGSLGFGLPLENSIKFAGLGVLSYLGKAVFPLGLSLTPSHHDVSIVQGLVALAMLSFLLCWGRPGSLARYRAGLVFMAAFLLPAAIGETYLEHRLYLPLMGLAAALVQMQLFRAPKPARSGWPYFAVIAVLMVMNWLHSASFRNGETAWAKAVNNSPNSWLAQNAMGNIDVRQGRFGPAEARYLKALEINPGQAKVLNNLGLLYLKSGRPEMAERAFSQLLARSSEVEKANYHMAQVMERLGRPGQAMGYYRRELDLNPALADAWTGLGALLAQTGQLVEAKQALAQALKITGDSYEAWLNLGVVEFRLKNLTEAVASLERAVKISPQRAEGRVNLGYAYRAAGDTAAAR